MVSPNGRMYCRSRSGCPHEVFIGPRDAPQRRRAGYERQVRPEKVDPFASYVYFGEVGLVAVVLIAHRGWTSRVAAHQIRAPLGRLPTQDLADEFPRRGERRSSVNSPELQFATCAQFSNLSQ